MLQKKLGLIPPSNGELQRVLRSSNSSLYPLVWEDHCTECAVPDCYSNCLLYRPIDKGKCSRLEIDTSIGLRTINVRPLTWSKIEARLAYIPLSLIAWERLTSFYARAVNALPDFSNFNLAKLFSRVFVKTTVLLGTRHYSVSHSKPRGILFLYGRMKSDVSYPMRIRASADSEVHSSVQLHGSKGEFGETFLVPIANLDILNPNNTPLISIDFGGVEFQQSLGIEELIVFSRSEFSHIPEFGPLKCVFWDLDNTLWSGVLLEKSDEAHLSIYPGIREILGVLNRSGVVNIVISKNDKDLVDEALKKTYLSNFFLDVRANWEPKSTNIKRALADLNLTTSGCVFVDDSTFERSEVASNYPEMLVLDSVNFLDLYFMIRKEASTQESISRNVMYKEEAVRRQDAALFPDYLHFLRNAELQIKFDSMSNSMDRAFELMSRSNQLNISGHRPSRLEFETYLSTINLHCFVARLSDRYGDYGTVAVFIARLDGCNLVIQNLAISCRAMSRFVELAIFRFLTNYFGKKRLERIVVDFKKTSRNGPIFESLSNLGFVETLDGLVLVEPDTLFGLEMPLNFEVAEGI